MLTRDQAAATWCPMVRIARVEQLPDSDETIVAGCNTDALGRLRVPASCRCIADKCAMWRWAPIDTAPFPAMTPIQKGDERHGYCGLAGRPA